MRSFRTKFLAIVVIGACSSLAFGMGEPSAMGFKDWKASRVAEAKSALEKVQTELDPNLSKGQSKSAANPKPQKRDTRLSQAQNNLAIAQELGAHDYFVLYLSQLKETDIQEAVKKLDPAEVAEIMIGIKKQLNADTPSEPILPITTPLPGGQKTTKNP